MIIRNIFIFVLIILSIILRGQATKEAANQVEFDSLFFVIHTNSKAILSHGQYMYKISQTDLQKARSCIIMGDGLYKQGRYAEAVEILEKGDYYVQKAKNNYWRIYLILLLINTYKYSGLHSKAEEYYNVMKIMPLEKEHERKVLLSQAKSQILEEDKKFCEASEIRASTIDEFTNKLKNEPQDVSKNLIIPARVAYFYDLIKCGNIEEARNQLNIIEGLITKANNWYGFNYAPRYYIGKALLLNTEKANVSEIKKLLNLAYESAVRTDTHNIIKNITEDILSTKLLTQEEEKTLYAKLFELGEMKFSEQGQLVERVISEKNNEIGQKSIFEKITYILLSILTFVTIGAFSFTRWKLKKNREIFLKIKDELGKEINSSNATLLPNRSIKDRFINEDLENQVLKKLFQFEEKKRYLKNDISAASMASLLKTTPRNLSFILKKHRNNDFNNYINEMRINYIIKALNNDPKLRNYKISALAEYCGYNSHSQFTIVFKNKKGISPSQYLEFLQEN